MITSNYLWKPEDYAWTRESHLANFMRAHGHETQASLHAASVRDTAWFWDAAGKDCGIEWFTPYAKVKDDSRGFPWTRWFEGGEVNIAHNCVDRHVRDGHGDETALYYEADSDAVEARRELTYAQLKKEVDACAGGLRQAGVGRGDSVALYASMRVETVVVMMATFKIGARFVPIFCGYGEQAVVERVESCGAKVLFAIDEMQRRGKKVASGRVARAAAEQVASVQRVICFDQPEWDEFLNVGRGFRSPPSNADGEAGFGDPAPTM